MNKFWWLPAAALIWGAAWTVAWSMGAPLHAGYLMTHAGLAVLAGSTAFVFGVRDRMCWAWLFSSLVGVLNCADAYLRPHAVDWVQFADATSVALAVAINLSGVVSTYIFVSSFSSVGLMPPWWRRAYGAGLIVGITLVGPSIWKCAAAALQGDPYALTVVISSLGDLSITTLLGPLLGTAFWMRGGALVWPFALIACNSVLWLAFDFAAVIGKEALAVMGALVPFYSWAFLGAAAIAHRWVVKAKV